MIKTVLDAASYLSKHLETSPLMTDLQRPNGDIYLFQRPQNSKREDVVINALGLTRDAVQEGLLQVNIYVPNREVIDPVTNITDKTLPNTKRLAYLNRLAQDSIEDVWAPDGEYTFDIQQDMVFPDENDQHFLNIRVEFFTGTLNN